MPLSEKTVFIKDPEDDMPYSKKNLHLSAKLANAPYVNYAIVRIERIEIGASGWWITHRVGKP